MPKQTKDMIRAPWAPHLVEALNRFQHAGEMHPFTCPREHFTDGEMVLVATEEGWICSGAPACGYTQGWAHSFMADTGEVDVIELTEFIDRLGTMATPAMITEALRGSFRIYPLEESP